MEAPEKKLPQVWVSLEPKRPSPAIQLALLQWEEAQPAIDPVHTSSTASVMDKSEPLPASLPPSARSDFN